MADAFPVLPFRTSLYGPDELFAGWSPDDPTSYARTIDFRAYASTRVPPTREVGMLRALHDQCISDARDELVAGRKVVAVMGGHALERSSTPYRQVAELSRSLTAAGVLVASGGGPGAMEATHLGALFAGHPDAALQEALDHLQATAAFPPDALDVVIDGTGEPDLAVLARLHAWQEPAFEVAASVAPGERGESLAIPTWFYGHEPPTPFASHLAKYFQNAVREDGLLAVAVDGVIYAQGRAGTVQEVFQDAAQNVYRVVRDRFSPMAFLDTDGCWSERLPVGPLLADLFGPDDYARHVVISSDPAAILAFLVAAR